MKYHNVLSFLKTFLSITALLSIVAVEANNVTPTLVFRSQGFHGDRQRNVGEVNNINLSEMESWYGTMDIAVGYMKSFRNDKMARCLFGDDLICNTKCKNTIKVQGSEVASRDAKAWLADYLYLNCEYDGSFRVDPSIQNVVVDLDFYMGLDEWVEGMYFRVYGPINWTKWQTKFCFNDPSMVLTSSCSTGYFTSTGDEVLLDSIADYFNGKSPTAAGGVTFQTLKFAKMPNCDETQTGFAELRAELGWHFIQDEDYHVGVGMHVAAPTGTKRKAEFVMDPTVGNGNHWELGATMHGHWVFWKSEDEENHVGFYVDAVITHLFKAKEQRTFDLLCRDNSRYMLASKFTKGVTNNLSGSIETFSSSVPISNMPSPTAQFNNEYAPVANLTTTDAKVSIGVQADIVAMFNFTAHGFSWDIGYNFWGRSCESIECPETCDPCNPNNIFLAANNDTWALKGDARMFGFVGETLGNVTVDDAQPLSATQNNADIHTGTNATTILGTTATTLDEFLINISLQNGGIDAPRFAYIGTGDGSGSVRLIHTPIAEGGFNSRSNQIKTSIQPIFINKADVALQETRGISHKVFTHLSYTWDRDWIPYLGIGGSAEFGKNENSCDSDCDANCGYCIDCSLSQWAIWIKGGVAFD